MTKQILLLRMGSAGYGVWRDDDLSVEARFSTMHKARSYLKRMAEQMDSEVIRDQLSVENDIYQIVQVTLYDVPLDPQVQEPE